MLLISAPVVICENKILFEMKYFLHFIQHEVALNTVLLPTTIEFHTAIM